VTASAGQEGLRGPRPEHRDSLLVKAHIEKVCLFLKKLFSLGNGFPF